MSASGRTTVRTRLQDATTELSNLEKLLSDGKHDIDARILEEFRQSVSHARETTSAIRQWMELRAHKGDPFTVLSALSAERVRMGTAVCKNVMVDLDSGDVTFQTPGLKEFALAVRDLYERLGRVVKMDSLK